MSNHTPGPWVTDNSVLRGSVNRLEEPRRHIALVSDWEKVSGDRLENEANARLIAAAPDLLEALQRVTDCLSKCLTGGEVSAKLAGKSLVQAAEAIAKATRSTD